MKALSEIQQAILRLDSGDLAELRAWFAAFDADEWDRELSEDAAAGRLDALADQALAETRAGRSRRL